MNRPRREDECYQCYRRHLKEEATELKQKMMPRVIWTSCILVADAKKKDVPEFARPLVKLLVRGTFNRFLGHTMPNSFFEKQKQERLIKKMEKKGIINDQHSP